MNNPNGMYIEQFLIVKQEGKSINPSINKAINKSIFNWECKDYKRFNIITETDIVNEVNASIKKGFFPVLITSDYTKRYHTLNGYNGKFFTLFTDIGLGGCMRLIFNPIDYFYMNFEERLSGKDPKYPIKWINDKLLKNEIMSAFSNWLSKIPLHEQIELEGIQKSNPFLSDSFERELTESGELIFTYTKWPEVQVQFTGSDEEGWVGEWTGMTLPMNWVKMKNGDLVDIRKAEVAELFFKEAA